MNAKIVDGELNFNPGDDKIIEIHKLHRHSSEMRAIRGGEISIVFQDPMTFLNQFTQSVTRFMKTLKSICTSNIIILLPKYTKS